MMEQGILGESAMATLGVHSECGRLRAVLVCRPGLAHRRLTPGNCAALLFDDVIWVARAQQDHAVMVAQMRAAGIEVLELHEALTSVLDDPVARNWLLARKVDEDFVGIGMQAELRALAGRHAIRHVGRLSDRRHRQIRTAV
ncbi:arginine deiminase family protein [Paludibacterium denitrificans]|uniref:arginine deiminase family protein n=1 Tax=Paludibacterium denitrificans TaxID=2675226 RepID=UPI002478233E|nr:arginine deiminase family protein [Paludibacterium denitrificans]